MTIVVRNQAVSRNQQCQPINPCIFAEVHHRTPRPRACSVCAMSMTVLLEGSKDIR